MSDAVNLSDGGCGDRCDHWQLGILRQKLDAELMLSFDLKQYELSCTV